MPPPRRGRGRHAGRRNLGRGSAPLLCPLGRLPYHEHFLHDLGAFQLGIGATLLLALAWRDAPTVALAGFLAANTLHAVSHAIDLDQGGHASDPYAIGAMSLLVAALVVRVRQRHIPTPVPEDRQQEPR